MPLTEILGNRKGVKMGLATSQVRLLALTSRKSDVEFRMQLNAKRKTMLMREGTTLSKLYYAKLQQARYQYSTGEGYNDVNYGYIMGTGNNNYEPSIEDIKNGTVKANDRNVPGAYITDASGNVVVNNELYNAIVGIYNGAESGLSTKELALKTIYALLSTEEKDKINPNTPQKIGANTGNTFSQNALSSSGTNLFDIFANYYIEAEGLVAHQGSGSTYGKTNKVALIDQLGRIMEEAEEYTTEDDPGPALGYYIFKGRLCYAPTDCSEPLSDYYTSGCEKGIVICTFDTKYQNLDVYKKIANLYEYYGDLLEHVYGNSGTSLKLSGLKLDENTHKPMAEAALYNTEYKKLQDTDYLQEAFRSGAFTLVCVENGKDASGLDYFINRQYFVEKADTDSRESITAWFNAKKAELDEKETYWDSEINALSTELETINTEMESIKSLRDNAIQTTFKWGAA